MKEWKHKSLPPKQDSQVEWCHSCLTHHLNSNLPAKMVAELAYHLGECNSAEDSDRLTDDFSLYQLADG